MLPRSSSLGATCFCLPLLGATACGANVVSVDVDAARPFAQTYWDSLKTNDVSKAIQMYDASIWNTTEQSVWSGLLGGLGEQFGPLVSADLAATKWVPGSSLVADHRSFVCYVYDFDVKRGKLGTRERLVICGEPDAPTEGLRIYGHGLRRLDTQQSIGIGVTIDEKPGD